MSLVESALNEYKRDAISKDAYLQRAMNILQDFYDEIAKNQDKLLFLIRKEGGNDWTYNKIPLCDNGGYSLSYIINKNKDILQQPFDRKGYEGLILYLEVNSIDVILKIRYISLKCPR